MKGLVVGYGRWRFGEATEDAKLLRRGEVVGKLGNVREEEREGEVGELSNGDPQSRSSFMTKSG